MTSGLDWTIVRPPRLVDGVDAALEVGTDLRIGSFASCPRRSLARLLVDEVRGVGHPGMAIAVRAVGAGRVPPRPTHNAPEYVWPLGAQE